MADRSGTEYRYLRIREDEIPLEIVTERRNSARISLATGRAILRIPAGADTARRESLVKWASDWVHKRIQRSPDLLLRYRHKDYRSGSLIQMQGMEFELVVEEDTPQKMATGQLEGRIIRIRLPRAISPAQKQKCCSTILSRILGKLFYPKLLNRVMELNALHFQKEVRSILLKHNQTNWGSCSSDQRINLSTRLLLTPPQVIDYIIVHELTHLIHMDHSPKFWARVRQVMPDYERAEAWLAQHGDRCRY
ncbi:MAG: M48 family metallopeptidase [Saprospiraceae bacterium]|nr:M48 family metallopeptidase [Saprospiraceae bacterium]